MQETIEVDLPAETKFLRNYDDFRRTVETLVDMPERTIDLLFRFLRQNDGQISARARSKEFYLLTDTEVTPIEIIYADTFPS